MIGPVSTAWMRTGPAAAARMARAVRPYPVARSAISRVRPPSGAARSVSSAMRSCRPTGVRLASRLVDGASQGGHGPGPAPDDAAGAPGAARPGRLGVGVVGAGRVGAVLGNALRAAGHAVVGVSAVSAASRERAELLLPAVPVLEVPDVVERAELVLLAVPDDALEPLVAGLAEVGAWQGGQLVVHTSGRHGWRVLAPATASGAIPLALHPAMTFTGRSLDLARLADCCFAVTAPAPVLPIGQALVVEMGAEPVVVAEEARPLYHAALAHGANHLVTLVAESLDLLDRGRRRVRAPGAGAAALGGARERAATGRRRPHRAGRPR